MGELEKRIKLEALISEREAMIIANKTRENQGYAYAYGEESFQYNANDMRKLLEEQSHG